MINDDCYFHKFFFQCFEGFFSIQCLNKIFCEFPLIETLQQCDKTDGDPWINLNKSFIKFDKFQKNLNIMKIHENWLIFYNDYFCVFYDNNRFSQHIAIQRTQRQRNKHDPIIAWINNQKLWRADITEIVEKFQNHGVFKRIAIRFLFDV